MREQLSEPGLSGLIDFGDSGSRLSFIASHEWSHPIHECLGDIDAHNTLTPSRSTASKKTWDPVSLRFSHSATVSTMIRGPM